ncbi:NADH dehydrogenase subunit 5 (mitochondrion) [Macrosteles quadrilineatus]|uniref:NADH-ubiquinone oxidoreductase chain 5 n=1 Tax=Macrosteles quadrilineatus TaxID=74068 RepID=A0A343CXA8_MACQU|nr:NADH dehydrogenase subunit 5 [Macrosteles quadrilineatus]ARQ26990.1 NADH dehydrogenase subunit 5 [Macrosteles quadrilineatus]
MWSIFLFMFSVLFFLLGLLLLLNEYSLLFEWVLFNFNSVNFVYIIYLDQVCAFFLSVVMLISSMVILYSNFYMGDYNYGSVRFLLLVLTFVFSMFLMIISPNLISILLGWDGLGLISYCLVIYYNSLKSYLAGMITCLINRLGDIGLLISISWMFSYGSWSFMFYINVIDSYLYYLIILSSFTKSAQIPFSSWLPAAMAAPTPVSSLVHSSTLVTAGVYLLIRFFSKYLVNNIYIIFISLLTMIMSSVCASYEFDLKKIIALSTLSQLGLMMVTLFMGLFELSFFHLLTHAMFKSLLFLCSGIIIHLMGNCQDIRFMGSICFCMPITCSCFNLANMALCGFPFLSGFYSKDLIVENLSFNGLNIIVWILFYLSLGLTVFYSLRLFYYTIITKFNYLSFSDISENINMMKYSVMFLCLFSIMFGCGYMWILNLDLSFLLLPFYLKLLTLVMVFMGLYLGFELTTAKFLYKLPMMFYIMNGSMWFMYSYSHMLYISNYYFSSGMMLNLYWGEFFGGLGISYIFLKFSNFIQLYHLNSYKIFTISMLIWLIIMI